MKLLTMRRFRITKNRDEENNRINFVLANIFLYIFLIKLKLFNLQIVNRNFFIEASGNQHGIYQRLIPERGKILIEDSVDKKLYPVAVNEQLFLVYSDSRIIKNPDSTAKKLTEILKPLWLKELNNNDLNNSDEYKEEDREKFIEKKNEDLRKKLFKNKDPYEVLAKRVPKKKLEEILSIGERGIGYEKENFRYYPESEILSQISGFVGYVDKEQKGRYGIEGHFDELLRGRVGSIASEKDARGYIIMDKNSKIVPAENGADIILTIDRSIQFKVCEELKKSVELHDADRGMVVVMNPITGAIIAMCSVPSFDANYYYKEKDIEFFNNPIIFDQYEPGSIFKAVTIAAGLDDGKILPNTMYYDKGCVKVGVETICNSDLKSHKKQSMINVLEKSLNTGTIFVLGRIGKEKFKKYVENFGFGKSTGIELSPESAGDINSLNLKREIYSATASFGQGISVTPLQMVNAFSAIANGGSLMKPYIVKKIVYSNGLEKQTRPKEIRRVISKKSAVLLSGILVSVVENGHGKRAGVPGYYVAGKTGTAQIPKKEGGGYEKDKAIGSFVGFAPVDNPRFAMLVRIDNPKDVVWAESSAAPLFGKLAKFMLNYYQIKPSKEN